MTASSVSVTDPTGTGQARRMVARVTERLGFGETDAGRAALVATELAGNLAKHAVRGGRFVAQPVYRDGEPGVELLSLDQAPGMANVAQCLADGYSTAGSPGTGLGAVSRVADEFEVHSAPGLGTAILARVWASGPGSSAAGALTYGVVSIPMPGQEVCGDGWAVAGPAGSERVLVVDGLGHGPDAELVSAEAARIFHAAPDGTAPGELLERMHAALRSTRGGAAAVAVIDAAAAELRYAGVGNISGSVAVPGAARSLVSHNGIVGHEMRKVQEFTYPFPAGALLVMHSDGVNTRWSLDRYTGIVGRDPALVAGVLLRDHVRGTDDATVLVARAAAAPAQAAA
jgi:anti-sigma regulatory factor (Ser/Thr protein kinase)